MSKKNRLIFLYLICLCIGIMGAAVNLQNEIINSFDILIQEIGLYIILIGTALSIFILHKLLVLDEFTLLPVFGKILIHGFSAIFISWGIAGFLSTTNQVFSTGKSTIIPIEIMDHYKRKPKNDYKYSFSYTRYYIKFIDINTKKKYLIQVHEDYYDDLLLQKHEVEMTKEVKKYFPKELLDLYKKNRVSPPKFKEYVELRVRIGALGLWE